MAITVESTPNPNAMKFTVGVSVGGPGTYVRGAQPDEPFLGELVEIDGVSSVFFTADFVTITKSPEGSWGSITPEATAILETHFDV